MSDDLVSAVSQQMPDRIPSPYGLVKARRAELTKQRGIDERPDKLSVAGASNQSVPEHHDTIPPSGPHLP
jgi:hypothetical protein